MSLTKAVIMLCALVSVASLVSAAYEPIEMNDTNRNKLPLEVGKGVDGLQWALANEFKFESLKQVKEFLFHCKYLNSYMPTTKDDQWDNLAGKIKSLMNEPKVIEGCQVEAEGIVDFASLDLSRTADGWLSKKNMNLVVELGKRLEGDAKLNLLFGHMYQRKKEMMGQELLTHAAKDTDVFFGEQESGFFKIGVYLSGCKIARVKPICKLVRRVKHNDVSAEGLDVKEFASKVAAKDEQVIQEHERLSGVSMGELKETCQSIKPDLYAINKINQFKELGLLHQHQIEQQAREEREFSFYYELANLCAAV